VKAGRFHFFEHPVHLTREKALEGTYLITTEEKDITPVEAVSIYKGLSEVDRAFANLKDVIEMRPMYHQADARVKAHIFNVVAA
jgi:transposase